MPQQIDPNTGRPTGQGTGDLDGGGMTIPGLSGLSPAHLVGDDYQLRPFEYFRNEGGRRYVQNAVTNPNEIQGYQPPPPPGSSSPPVAPPPAPVGGVGSAMPGALPPPQTGGAEPNQNQGGQSFSSMRDFFGANPWASFFQGLSRTQGQPGTTGVTPQGWQQTQRGFNPGSPSVSLPPPSPYPEMLRPAVMPWGGSNKSPFGQTATPEAGNQGGMAMPGGQSMPPWFRKFQAMLPQQSALPAPQTTGQPLANTGYFPPPSLPAPIQEQGQFNGGPG